MAWVAALVGLGTVSLLFIIMSYPIIGKILPIFQEGGTLYVNDTNVQNVYTIIQTVWAGWPIVMIVGLLLFVMVASQRRDQSEFVFQ